MPAEVRIPAASLRSILTQASMPVGSHRLFKTISLEFKQDSIEVVVTNEDQTCMLIASYRPVGYVPVTLPDAPIVVQPEDWESYLKRFKDAEVITVTFDGRIQLKGTTKTFTHYPTAELKGLRPTATPVIKDGVVWFKKGEVRAPTIVKVTAEEFHELIEDADTVEVPLFPLHFSVEQSLGKLGSTEAKHDSVDTVIKCTVEGETRDLVLGEPLVYAMKNLTGPLELQMGPNTLVCILQKSDTKNIVVGIAPKRQND